jgi:hypothetical protein
MGSSCRILSRLVRPGLVRGVQEGTIAEAARENAG